MSGAGPLKSRIVAFDGLRGIAAFIVIVSHFVLAFTPGWFTGSETLDWSAPDIVAKTPLFLLQSGTFAVFVFFALSGFVMAQSASLSRAPLLALAITRYLRLNVPVLASLALALVLIALFPGAIIAVADKVDHGWVAGWYRPGGPSVGAAIFDVLRVNYKATLYYNPVVWTMKVELIGSLVIYVVYKAVPGQFRVPVLIAGILFAFIEDGTNGYLFGFFAGALLYEHWARGRGFPVAALWAALAAGLAFGSLPFAAPRGPGYEWLYLAFDPVSSPDMSIRNIGAILLLAGVLYLPGPRALMATMIPRFLGRISFALYLVHFPILCTVVAAVWLRVGPDHQWAMFTGYAAVTVFTAWLVTIAVDEPSIHVLARIRKGSQGWTGAAAYGAGQHPIAQGEATKTPPA